MSLPNYLAKIKSSGIYRFVWDKSQVTSTDAETLRLVVGYSEKGPFNTPVYIENTSDFKTIFGDINKKLEKRGVFFHRMAMQALSGGPILALNLKNFTGDEKVQYATVDTTDALTVSTKGVAVDKIYNTNRFWTLNPDGLTDFSSAADSINGTKPYIIMAAADSDSTSNTVFIRPCTMSGYDVTIKSWYTTTGEEMPDYFDEYSDLKVSDFLAEIYVFKGQFTPAIAQSEELKSYFNVDGDKVTLVSSLSDAWGNGVDVLDSLASNENSGFIQKYQGSILPYFKNASGAYMSLDLLFNSDYNKHKMIMKLNNDLLEDDELTVDKLITSGFNKVTANDVECSIKDTLGVAHSLNGGITTFSDGDIKPSCKVYDSVTSLAEGQENPTEPTDYVTVGTNSIEVVNVNGYISTDTAEKRVSYDIHAQKDEANFNAYILGKDDTVTSQDKTIKIVGCSAVAFSKKFTSGNRYLVATKEVSDVLKQELHLATLVNAKYTFNEDSMNESTLELTFNKVCAPIKVNMNDTTTDDADTTLSNVIVECDNIIKGGTATAPVYIKGYTKLNTKPASSSVEDKLAWQKYILGVLSADSATGYPGLIEALTNRNDIDYRYIVDTFETFIDNEVKSTLSLLAKKKDNCLLLTNFPAIQTFIKSKNASFTDDNGVFKMKYVKAGANTSKPASVLFSLPSEDNGASWCSFNTPVVFTDGTVKTTVPSAALVSNNFMEKYSSRQPYYIVAGPNYGKLSYSNMVGPDYNFSRDDLDILEPMGVNCIVYRPRVGSYINSNQTAKQNPVTALSKINVRELVIYIQDQIEDMLQDYQWEFNTSSLRDRVKAKADTILENVSANGGVYAYENVCDSTNNTDEIIANEMLVLSTSIEPGYGAGKMVQELTLYSKGKLSTSTTVSQ